MKIKPELRKGVWLHLVGVFHPDMRTREERELYFNKLRRVYDSLRGKREFGTCVVGSVVYLYSSHLHVCASVSGAMMVCVTTSLSYTLVTLQNPYAFGIIISYNVMLIVM